MSRMSFSACFFFAIIGSDLEQLERLLSSYKVSIRIFLNQSTLCWRATPDPLLAYCDGRTGQVERKRDHSESDWNSRRSDSESQDPFVSKQSKGLSSPKAWMIPQENYDPSRQSRHGKDHQSQRGPVVFKVALAGASSLAIIKSIRWSYIFGDQNWKTGKTLSCKKSGSN